MTRVFWAVILAFCRRLAALVRANSQKQIIMYLVGHAAILLQVDKFFSRFSLKSRSEDRSKTVHKSETLALHNDRNNTARAKASAQVSLTI